MAQMMAPKYFKGFSPVQFEGAKSKNTLAYKYFDKDREVMGITMGDLLNCSIAYWHAMEQVSADPFGGGTQHRPWKKAKNQMTRAYNTLYALFELAGVLGVEKYCFHDRDMAPEGKNLKDSNQMLWKIVKRAKEYQEQTGVGLLWATQNLFSHERYARGALTNPNSDIVEYALAQIKTALDVGHELGAENHVFWGGREGYQTLLNTSMKRELERLAIGLHKAVDYARRNRYNAQFLIEPKPMEPTKHQYDFDAAACLNFLREHNLLQHLKLNIEANHATLAGHDFGHELQVASDAYALGSVDANRGDPRNGWDTDQFPIDVIETTMAMITILMQGGLGTGGLNFDAKIRRESTELEDLIAGHVGGIDAFAHGALVAEYIIQQYGSGILLPGRYDQGKHSLELEAGRIGLEEAEAHTLERKTEPKHTSGKQEILEINFADAIRLVDGREWDNAT